MSPLKDGSYTTWYPWWKKFRKLFAVLLAVLLIRGVSIYGWSNLSPFRVLKLWRSLLHLKVVLTCHYINYKEFKRCAGWCIKVIKYTNQSKQRGGRSTILSVLLEVEIRMTFQHFYCSSNNFLAEVAWPHIAAVRIWLCYSVIE